MCVFYKKKTDRYIELENSALELEGQIQMEEMCF